MTQIQIIGDFFSTSGYAVHCRELANALAKLTKVRLSTALPPNWLQTVNDRELEMIKNQPEDDEINLIISHPMNWRVNCNAKRNWVFLVWEGDRVPTCFIDECLNPNIEYIFVPSTHTLNALDNTCGGNVDIIDKVKIMPHGVDLEKFYPKVKTQRKKDDELLLASHLEARSKAEADNLQENMTVDVDNHAENNI